MKAVINQNLDEEPSMLMQIDQTLLDRTKKSSAMQRAFCFFPISTVANFYVYKTSAKVKTPSSLCGILK